MNDATPIIEITDILNRARGERLVYHRGYLPIDRGGVLEKEKRSAEMQAVDATAEIAWNLWDGGKVHLVQRRRGHLDYEYIAVRR